ncbi:DNA repair protein endonuclease SAE2/CtIP C-terminus-domain-containing protein [Cyathus striatus]|nr:DNA repair protein endonuclease SAE2/CtIP C-terminus-domain-containing protein [Cyathus striatus]
MAPETYTSVQLRERDKRVEEKYQKTISECLRRIERQKTSYNDIQRQVFELENRIDRLAKGLGFNNAFEAQLEVDTSELEGGFKGCLEKIASLNRELNHEKDEKEMLLMEAEEEKAKLREQLERVIKERHAESKEARQIRKDHEDLQSKYDQLEDKRQRAAERYKSDYKKWKVFHDWLVDDDDPAAPPIGLVKQFNFEERRKYLGAVAKKKKVAVQAGAQYPVPERFEWEDVPDNVQENNAESADTPGKTEHAAEIGAREATYPVPERMRQRREPPSSTVTITESTQQHVGVACRPSPLLVPKQEPSASPTIFNTSLTPLSALGATAPKARIPSSDSHSTTTSSSNTVVNSSSTTPIPSENAKAGHKLNFPLQVRSSTPTDSSAPATIATATPKATYTRIPLTFRPVLDTKQNVKVKQEPQSAFKLAPAPKHVMMPSWSEQDLDPGIPNSSDTEDDSQAPILPLTFTSKVPLLSGKPAKLKKSSTEFILGTSQTEDDSQAPMEPTSLDLTPPTFTTSTIIPLALAGQAGRVKYKRRNSDSILAPRLSQEDDPSLSDIGPSRPNKVRRVTGIEFARGRILGTEGKENRIPDGLTPRNRGARAQKGVMSTGRGKQWALEKENVKGKEKEKDADFDTPIMARNAGQKKLDDYSAYKGRGRYGKNASKNTEKTINSMFAIDAVRNGGVAHAYDEVVRNKEQRKKMEASDCECCRDYYEAIGPLPPRQQGPLWGTPSPKRCRKHLGINADFPTSPTPGRSSHHSHASTSEVASHKAAISRHRQTWARAATPPNYWNIGFPDTQEVADINERANVMHRKKLEQVEREADSGEGRWRKR